MKLTVIGAATLAALATASPLSSTISMRQSEGESGLAHKIEGSREICLAICYLEKPTCMRPSYAKKFGECWTCCTRQRPTVPTLSGRNNPTNAVSILEENKSLVPKADDGEACLRMCMPRKPDCMSPSYPKQLGKCWTCCTRRDSPSVRSVSSGPTYEINNIEENNSLAHKRDDDIGEVCLLICYEKKPACKRPGYPRRFGECWTCCKAQDKNTLEGPH